MSEEICAKLLTVPNIGKKNANLEEKSATCCKNLLQKWR